MNDDNTDPHQFEYDDEFIDGILDDIITEAYISNDESIASAPLRKDLNYASNISSTLAIYYLDHTTIDADILNRTDKTHLVDFQGGFLDGCKIEVDQNDYFVNTIDIIVRDGVIHRYSIINNEPIAMHTGVLFQ